MAATHQSSNTAQELTNQIIQEIRLELAIPENRPMAKLENAVENMISDSLSQEDVQENQNLMWTFYTAGWRPLLGWICSLALFIYYIPRFLLGTVFWAIHAAKTGQFIPMPEMGVADIIGLITTLLGTSGMRTLEKLKGVHDNH